ncbi:MAG: hypothetical protein PHN69_00420 [Candidatus Pacebacteria bacterium]|nr:hypothetical protein [Candidatus Paceibacterota bacterium]
MPPQEQNQIEPNNQIPSTNTLLETHLYKKKLIVIISLIIFVIVLVLFVLFFFSKNPLGEENIKESSLSIVSNIPQINEETKLNIEEDISELIKGIGIDQPTFDLDVDSKLILSDITTSIKASSTIIFNSIGYKKIESYKNGNIYYIKPVDSSISETEYLHIITKEIIKPEELLDFNGDQTKKDIHTFFYNDFVNGVSYEKTVTTLKTYLDKQVSSGVLSKYEYDDIDGSLLLYYPDKELGEQLNPSLYTKYMDKIISYNANPDKYLNELLKSSQQEFDSGNILIINTKGDAPIFKIINRDVLLNNISILLDDNLNKEEKIKAIAGPVRYGIVLDEKNKETSLLNKLKTSFIAFAASSGDINNLLGQSGAIVSPSRAINIFQGVDIPGKNLGDFVIEEFYKNNGVFSSFVKNGYWANVVQHRRTGEPTIEKFAKLFDDANSTNIIYDGHGTPKGKLFMESYYLGKNKEDSDYISNREKFVKRVDNLQDIYGNDSIAGWEDIYSLSDEMLSQMGTWNSDVSLISLDPFKKEDRIFGEIAVTPNFFDAYKSNQKSLVIFVACFSGQLANVINARVLLTAPANSATSIFLFFSDLSKIDLYLLKNQEPGNISFNLDESRTYDILGKFKSDLVISNASSSATIDEKTSCNGKSDTLCTVVFSGSSGQTLAVSPSVKSINGGTKISFNAPLENENVDAKDVVTIDARQCFTSQKILDENKPKWSGDKDITLSWKDKIYRDWQEKDFYENGAPKVNYAIITVKNNKAVSKISEVNLTGNQDACKGERCVSKEAYKDPAEIKLNGNQPNTDFVAMFPCIKEEYYKTCKEGIEPEIVKIIDEDNEYAGLAMPNWIRFSGNCYYNIINLSDQEKEKATEAKEWNKSDDCQGKCIKKEDFDDGCFKPLEIIEVYNKYDPSQKLKVLKYIDGEVVFEERDESIPDSSYLDTSRIESFDSFGDHVAYLILNHKGYWPDEQVWCDFYYDGKIITTIDGGSCIYHNIELYADGYGLFNDNRNLILGDSREDLIKKNNKVVHEVSVDESENYYTSTRLISIKGETFSTDITYGLDELIYDGINLGPGNQYKIFGDNLFYFRDELLVNEDVTIDQYINTLPDIYPPEHIRNPVIMYNNKPAYYLKDYWGLNKKNGYKITIFDYFNKHFIACYNDLGYLEDPEYINYSEVCFYDNKKISETSIDWGEVFGDNYIYSVGGATYYNGKKIMSSYAQGISSFGPYIHSADNYSDKYYSLFGNHVAVSDLDSYTTYSDGKIYDYDKTNANNLIHKCALYYYNNLPTSEYGSNKYFDLVNNFNIPPLPDLHY